MNYLCGKAYSKQNGIQWSGVERSRAERGGVEWSGVVQLEVTYKVH